MREGNERHHLECALDHSVAEGKEKDNGDNCNDWASSMLKFIIIYKLVR